MIINEKTKLTNYETGIQSQDSKVSGIFDDLYWLQVPVGQEIVLLPESYFSIYLKRLALPVDSAQAFDSPAYVDETVAANSAAANDMTLMPAVETTDDLYYIGYRFPFQAISLILGTSGVGNTIQWQYYNGASWVALPNVSDLTLGLTAAPATYAVNWTIPRDWAATTINGQKMYWIRIAITVAGFTTQPLGTRCYIGGAVESPDNERVQLVVRSEDKMVDTALVDFRYEQVKEFADITKKSMLNLNGAKRIVGGQWLVIKSRADQGLIDVSECYFNLDIIRVRESIMDR